MNPIRRSRRFAAVLAGLACAWLGLAAAAPAARPRQVEKARYRQCAGLPEGLFTATERAHPALLSARASGTHAAGRRAP